MDDDVLEPKDLDDDMDSEIDDDILISGNKKGKKGVPADDSLDLLAEEEDETLPEDEYDDKDLW